MENIELMDYVTEKVYDAYFAGAVPIYLGAPNVVEFLPGVESALMVRSFSTAQNAEHELLRIDLLAAEIRRLLADPEALRRKRRFLFPPDSPVMRRCHELERLGTVLPESARHLREDRQYDRMGYTLCAACEAAREAATAAP